MPSSPETIDPPETLEIRSSRASSPSSLSRRSAPTWNSIAREPPPERHSPDVPGSGGCFLSLGTKWTGHVAASPVTSMSCEPPRVVSSTIESPPDPCSPFTLTRSSQPRRHPDDVQARAHRGILTKGARLAEPPSTSHHRVAHDQRAGCGSHRPGRHVRRVSGCHHDRRDRLPRHPLAGLGPGSADPAPRGREGRRLHLARRQGLARAGHPRGLQEGHLHGQDRLECPDDRDAVPPREPRRHHVERRQAHADLPVPQLRQDRRLRPEDGLRAAPGHRRARWPATSCRSAGSGSAATASIRSRTASWSSRSSDHIRSRGQERRSATTAALPCARPRRAASAAELEAHGPGRPELAVEREVGRQRLLDARRPPR